MNTAEVLNTPGYYYAIAYALSVFVITCTNERKIGRWKLAAVSCAQFALLLFFFIFNMLRNGNIETKPRPEGRF